jgi:hypothetical protein
MKESRLSAAGRADDGEELPARDIEVDGIQSDDRLGALVNLADGPALDGGHAGRISGPPSADSFSP